MAEYEGLDARVRSLEIWRGEMVSVKSDVDACDLAIDGHRDQLQKLERRMEDAERVSGSLERRISKNEASATWLGNWKQRAQGITSTLAILYVGIELMYPGSVARGLRGLLSAMIGGNQP